MHMRSIMTTACLTAIAASPALGASVNFGNQTVYNNPLTIIPFNAPTGGTYVKFVFTTNWSYGFGTATSSAAAWYVGNPTSTIIASLTSVTGMANNGNSTTITVAGNFSIGVTSAMSLQWIAAQNQFTSGLFNVQAFWSSTVLNFYVQKPPPPIPVGVEYFGASFHTSGQNMTISTGGSTFNPTVGLYDSDGYLVGSSGGGGTVGLPPSTALENSILRSGTYYVFIGGEGTVLGAEDYTVDVPPGTTGGTLGGGIDGVAWPVAVIPDDGGQWFSFTVVPPPCPGDITGDGSTNVADFNVLASHFGQMVPPFQDGDLNGDGFVTVADFNILASNFGCSS